MSYIAEDGNGQFVVSLLGPPAKAGRAADGLTAGLPRGAERRLSLLQLRSTLGLS